MRRKKEDILAAGRKNKPEDVRRNKNSALGSVPKSCFHIHMEGWGNGAGLCVRHRARTSLFVRFMEHILRYDEYDQNGKGQDAMEHTIVWVRGHVEVYDAMGEFCFSADSEREAREELRQSV